MSERKTVRLALPTWATYDVEVSMDADCDGEREVEIHSIELAQRGFMCAPVQRVETTDLSEEDFARVEAAAAEAFGAKP
jgi:hypothetical protein